MSSFACIITHTGTSVNENARLAYALRYARLGWKVLPLHTIKNGACTCGQRAKCRHPGKHPQYDEILIPNGLKNASDDPNLIRQWWKMWPDANIGVLAGASGSGIVALDIDVKGGGIDWLNNMIDQHGLPQTVKAKTGSGGYHILFKAPEWHVHPTAKKIAPAVDVRGDGSIIVVEPSRHISGKQYVWGDGCSPWDIEPAELPDWVEELLRKATKRSVEKARQEYKGRVWQEYLNSMEAIPEGARNNTLFRLACSMRARSASYEDMLCTLQEANRLCDPPLDEGEIETIARSATRYEQGKKPDGKKYPLTDAGNAERFADRHGPEVKFTRAFHWIVWDETRWIIDETGEVVRRAIETARAMKEEAAQIVPHTPEQVHYKEVLHKFAHATESKNKLKSMLELAQAMPLIATSPDRFDSDPWLLNLQNGTLNRWNSQSTAART